MTTNNDDWGPGPIYTVEKLARIVLEASKSNDPDVLAALENLDEVLQRSKVRELQANIKNARGPTKR